MGSVDFSQCKEITASYRELPADVTIPTCSGRTPLCDEVLNDYFISIPIGSEDYSFKATRKNVYEENLFKCEDERFEVKHPHPFLLLLVVAHFGPRIRTFALAQSMTIEPHIFKTGR